MTDLETITIQLAEAQADLALLQRLNTAESRVKQLTKAYDLAQDEHDAREAANEVAAREALMEGITDIRVVGTPHQGRDDSVLSRTYSITYTRLSFDGYANQNLPKQRTVTGFRALPAEVMMYLTDKRPERIPEEIMALAPGRPLAAFDEYFIAQRRGYLTGNASA